MKPLACIRTLGVLLAAIGALPAMDCDAAAQVVSGPAPTFALDLANECASEAPPTLPAWRISARLDRALWPVRLTCTGDGPAKVLRVEVRPGDAFDPNPTGLSTERVEIQPRRELVRFDQPIWYAFRFRLREPWVDVQNCTVIHQIKQSIEPAKETDHGGPCPPANPFFKIEAGYRNKVSSAAFVVKVRGTNNCTDGKSGATICGPWPLKLGEWHRINVALTPSQARSDLRVWLDGRSCEAYRGPLGYLDHGRRSADGKPTIDTQPRFGIYRDTLDAVQAIDFADIAFWHAEPVGHPAWSVIGRTASP